MKRNILFFAIVLFIGSKCYSQSKIDSLKGFDLNGVIQHIHDHNIHDSSLVSKYLNRAERDYINKKYKLRNYRVPPKKTNNLKTQLMGCASQNWGFENGNFGGWTKTGNVTIVNGGTDPYGNFPWVYNGASSAKICADKSAGGIHGKLSKDINVPSTGTTLFTFHFAMVIFNFPHDQNDAAKFHVDFYDGSGQKLACPQYECYYESGVGPVGVANMSQTQHNATYYNPSAEGAGSHNVTYSPWNTISMDLSGYAGQTITAVFSVDWCIYDVDWAYALIDADCPVNTEQGEEICGDIGQNHQICAASGMQSYTWFDANNNQIGTNRCVDISAAGEYHVEMIPQQVQCTSAPTITFNYTLYPNPEAHFSVPDECFGSSSVFTDESTVSNVNTSSIIADWKWDFGDGNTSVVQNPTHPYASPDIRNTKLVVTTNHGCKDSISIPVNVNPIPHADFSIDSVCKGIGSSFTEASTVDNTNGDNITNWDWSFGDGQSSSNQNPSHQYNAANIYDIALIVTTNNGCKDTAEATTAVYPLPNVDFLATDECLYNENQFTDQSTVPSNYTTNSIVDLQWDFDDGNTATGTNVSNQYINPGNYDVLLVATTNHNCVDSIRHSISVFDPPSADFSFNNVCDNEEVELTNTTVYNAGSAGDANFFWDIDGDGTTDHNTENVNNTYSQDGIYHVQLIVEDVNGCRDTVNHDVTVYALPHAVYSVTNVCEDTTTTFSNSSFVNPVDNDNIAQYDWDFGNGTSSNVENPTIDYGNENIYTTQLVITTNYGCKDSISHPVNVYPLPNVDFSPTEVCLGFNTQFQDKSSVSNAHTSNQITNWNWNFDDGDSSIVQNPHHIYASDGIFNAVLTIVTNHNCVKSKTIPVTVWPKPDVSFSGIDLEGCAPICPKVKSNSTINNPSSLVDYQWRLSDGTVYGGSAPSFTDCYDIDGGQDVYYGVTLTVTSDEGCVDSLTKDDYIKVYHNPIASFYSTPDKPDIIHNTVDFHNTSSFADTYLWSFEDAGTSNDVDPSIDFPNKNPGTYDVQLVAMTDKSCYDTAWAKVRIYDRVLVYVPNTFTPDQDNYNELFKPVLTSGFDPYDYTLYIFNRWGELVFESHNTNVGWDGTYGGKIAKEGTYIWKITFKESETDKHHTLEGHVNLLR